MSPFLLILSGLAVGEALRLGVRGFRKLTGLASARERADRPVPLPVVEASK
jgi:hypothetical protein